MKKSYSKPEIMFESFAASTNIAACGVDTDLPVKYTCGIQYGPPILNQVVFDSTISQCNVDITETDMYNKVCYDNPSDTSALFGS